MNQLRSHESYSSVKTKKHIPFTTFPSFVASLLSSEATKFDEDKTKQRKSICIANQSAICAKS